MKAIDVINGFHKATDNVKYGSKLPETHMTPMELIRILDKGMVEELTMYFEGHKSVVNLRDLPNVMPNYQIAKLWNSESGKGISILLADK